MTRAAALPCAAAAILAASCTRDLEVGILLAHDGGGGASSTASSSSVTTTGAGGAGGGSGGGSGGPVILLGCKPVGPEGGAGVEAVAKGADGTLYAHDASFLYWVHQGFVGPLGSPSFLNMVPIACEGEVRSFNLGVVQVAGITTDAMNVYLTLDGPPTLLAMPLGGTSPPAPMLTGSAAFGDVAAGFNSVFWATPGDGTIFKTPVGGTTATIFASGEATPTNLLAETIDLLWLDAGTGELRIRAYDGTMASTVFTAQGHAVNLVRQQAGAYWIEQSTSTTSHDGRVIFLHLGPGVGPAVPLAQGLDGPNSLAVDADNAYWTDGLDGTVLRVPATPADGGAPFVVAKNQASPAGIQIEGAYVYWIDYDTRTLYRAPK